MDVASIPISELLPHGPEMTLIDRLISYDPRRSVAVASVNRTNVFASDVDVPAWVGIEYMAQTIAAHAGFEARQRGEPPPIGFLLGTRLYRCSVVDFAFGSELRIVVQPLIAESGFGAFDCSIETETVVATAIVNTYQPEERVLAALRRKL